MCSNLVFLSQVHPVHPSETLPPDVSGVRGVRQHRAVGAHGVPAHARGQHAVQGVARIAAQVSLVIEKNIVLQELT